MREYEVCIVSMQVSIKIMTHTIPDSLGIAFPAMVVLTVKQSVFVVNSLLHEQPSIAVCAVNVANIFLGHDVPR